MPSEAQYIRALRKLDAAGLTRSWKDLLRAHWASPGHTSSMALLASAAKYKNDSAANLNYGRLAARVGRLVGMPPGPSRINLYSLATWGHSERSAAGHFTFSMRPSLARALEALGWTKGARAPVDHADPRGFVEGERRVQLTQHIQRERRLRAWKLLEAQRRSPDGHLRCEVPGCGFDFWAVYGSPGRGYAEVHHLKPLGSRQKGVRTPLADMAVVCANCHAMIHRFGACQPLRGLVRRKAGRRR